MTFIELQILADCFLKKVFGELDKNAFVLEPRWHIDHLCFRTSSQEDYQHTKNQFVGFSKLLIESEVNGRPISTFKLKTPLTFEGWDIDLIEIPAPKKGKITARGFEHIEVVCDLTFDEIKLRSPNCHFNESALIKDFNQELKVCFDGFSVKFHHLSLESVINLESNKSVFSALAKSKILVHLKSFFPLVAGTFPLNINTADSDVDILISDADFNSMKQTLEEKFGSCTDFKCQEIYVQGEPTLLTSFSYESIAFEVFGQTIPSLKQRAYLHFLVEERLLKFGGSFFATKIKEARQQGIKTEPAFARTLGLKGDPYEELVALQTKNNHYLKGLMNSV